MIVILADDLTSALDGAAPFAERGLSATVLLDETGLMETCTDVVAVDLDSRFLAPDEAEARFERASRRVPPDALIYKTIDSTLRGNMGPEIRGALRGSGRAYAVVAPAFPSAGRATVGGYQFVNGVPLEQTAFAQDQGTPVPTGRVADRLGGLNATQFTVYDASQDEALDELVTQINWDPGVLWVGSPGLATAIARALPRPVERSNPRAAPSPPVERVLVVVGSLHEANGAQLECVAAAGGGVVTIERNLDTDSLEPVLEELRRSFANTSVVALTSPRQSIHDTDTANAIVSERLAGLVRRTRAKFQGLVLTGGATARRVVDALGASRLDLSGEVEPGVALGVLQCADGALAFAAKAGGFGSSTTLLRCVERVRSGA